MRRIRRVETGCAAPLQVTTAMYAPPGFRSAFERPANCTAIRANNSRALVLWNIDRTRILPVIDALDDAGFEVGVLHEACRPGDFEHSICTVDSPRIRFVRRVDTINPQRLMDAVKSFVPCAGFQKWVPPSALRTFGHGFSTRWI